MGLGVLRRAILYFLGRDLRERFELTELAGVLKTFWLLLENKEFLLWLSC